MNEIIPVNLQLRFHYSEKSILCNRDFSKSVLPKVYYKEDIEFYYYFGIKYYSITYYMFYQENYAIGLFGLFPYCKFLGYHEQDIEYIRILYNIDTLNPEFVFFSSHSQEGIWKKYDECEFFKNNLIVYVAKYSHANKPHKKTYYRLLGFANDKTSNMGNHLIPTLEKDNSLHKYNMLNKEVFSNPCSSFFMPFILYKEKKLIQTQQKKDKELVMTTTI